MTVTYDMVACILVPRVHPDSTTMEIVSTNEVIVIDRRDANLRPSAWKIKEDVLDEYLPA